MITIIGPLLTELGHSMRAEVRPDWRERKRASVVSSLEVRQRQQDRIPLNLDHDRELEVGEIMACAKSATATSGYAPTAEADKLLELDEPIYFSAETTRKLDDSDVLIEGAALTTAPATISLQPAELLRGASIAARPGCFTASRKDLIDQAVERHWQYRPGPLHVRDAATEAMLGQPIGDRGVLVGDQLGCAERAASGRVALRAA